MKKIKKILVIRLGAIGDVIHTTIIANAIKNIHPEVEVHFLTSDFISPLLKKHPFIDKVVEFENQNRKSLSYIFNLAKELRSQKYDYTINLTNSLRNFLLAFLINGTHVIQKSHKGNHAVEVFYNSANKVFKDLILPKNLTLDFEDSLKKEAQNILKNHKPPYIILNPGGQNNKTREGRVLSIDKWIELSSLLIKKYNASIIVTGSKNEADAHRKFSEIENVLVLTGKLSLAQTASLFSLCSLMISIDSGPLHIASAVKGLNTIGIYGSTDPEICGPYGENKFVISADTNCKFCHKKVCKKNKNKKSTTPCMDKVNVSDIINLIDKEGLLESH